MSSIEDAKIAKDVEKMRILRESPYIPIEPTTRQWAFILDDRKEVFFGGAAGGGKSIALLANALLYVHEPKYRALLLRRTYQDLVLPGALMDLADQWLMPTDAKRKKLGTEWWFPSGAKLTFGYMANDSQKYRYQGAAFNFIGWDELTQFSEDKYTYLFSRCRHAKTDTSFRIPDRIRCTGNPGGIGHEWVKTRFINPLDGDTQVDRLFIPSKMTDNPHLDRDAYESMLRELDPVTRAQLEMGNWDIQPSGNFFLPTIKAVQEHSSLGRWRKGTMRCRAWDLAATETGDWAVGVLIARDRVNRRYRVEDVVRVKAEPEKLEKILRETALKDGPFMPQIIELEGGSAGKLAMRDLRTRIFHGSPVFPVPATGNKLARARLPATIVAAGELEMAPAAWNHAFVDELIGFPTGLHDDQVDALSHGIHWLVKQGGADKPRDSGHKTRTEIEAAPVSKKRTPQSRLRIVR